MEGGEQESLVSTARSNMVNLEGRCPTSGKPPPSCSLAHTAWVGAPRPVPVPPVPNWHVGGSRGGGGPQAVAVWLLAALLLRCLRAPLRAGRGGSFSGSACFQIVGGFLYPPPAPRLTSVSV